MFPVRLIILVQLLVQGTEIILFNQIKIIVVLQRAGEFILLQEVQAECRQINPGNVQVQIIIQEVIPVRILPTIHIHHPEDQAVAADHLEVPVADHLEVQVQVAVQGLNGQISWCLENVEGSGS